MSVGDGHSSAGCRFPGCRASVGRERLRAEVLRRRGGRSGSTAQASLRVWLRPERGVGGAGSWPGDMDLGLGPVMEAMASTVASGQGGRVTVGGTPGRDGRLCNTSRESSTEEGELRTYQLCVSGQVTWLDLFVTGLRDN